MLKRGTTGIIAFMLVVGLYAFNFSTFLSAKQDPTPTPTQTGVQQITVKQSTLTGHDCSSSEWQFIINQIDTPEHRPASITVTWANGASEVVPLSPPFTSNVAHYTTSSNLNSTVTNATAVIYSGWSGNFNLSLGPCNNGALTQTPTPITGTTTPTPTSVTTTATTTPALPTATPTNPPAGGPTATPELGRGGVGPILSPTAPARAQGGGQVLGVNTFAATGEFEDSFINFIFMLGCALLAYSGFTYTHAPKKNR